ncbi:MAG: PadR family transcriptional regulator [Methanosphaera stadtmanae]|nr:PadR family transcriptional regulator [Methanosphaera stadtmanae]
MVNSKALPMDNLTGEDTEVFEENIKMFHFIVNGLSHFLTLWIIHKHTEIYGYGIMKELNLFLDCEKGCCVKKFSSSKIYPLLKKMENANLIEGKWKRKNNKQIKSYKTTQKGELLISNILTKVSSFKENEQWKLLLDEIESKK